MTWMRTLAPALLAASLAAAPTAGAEFSPVRTWAFTWESLFEGTRNEALGSADLAAPAGPEAILSAPAALPTGRDGVAAAFGYFEYYSGLILRHYALAGDLGRWRFQSGWSEVSAETHTATLTAIEARDRIQTFGVSRQLAGGEAGRRPRLAFGASLRHYASRINDSSLDGDAFDLGLIGDYPLALSDGGSLTLGAAVALRNAFGATLDLDDGSADLPKHWRAGLALTLESTPWPGLPGGARLQALYTRRQGLDEWDGFDADLFGAEMTLGGVLALRVGSDSYQFSGSQRLGLGVILYDPERWPVGLWLDWTQHVVYPDIFDRLEQYSLRARVDF